MAGKHLKALMLAATLAVSGAAAQAAVVYSDNASDFRGIYRGVGTLDVTFTSAAAGTGSLSFDLFGARSVDGFKRRFADLFTVAINGVDVFSGYFKMGGGGSNLVVKNDLGWAWATTSGRPGGVTSVSGDFQALAGLNTFSVSFSSPGRLDQQGQGTRDESWALNDLDITTPVLAAVPVPAALGLLGAGIAGLGLLGLGRKRKPAA